MFDKFKRTNFMKEVTSADGIQEYDFLLSNWDLFQINTNITFNTVQVLDIQRPDYMSLRIYGSSEYWWILCKYNKIDDIWNDLYVGMDLVVPSLFDINSFYERVKQRFRK